MAMRNSLHDDKLIGLNKERDAKIAEMRRTDDMKDSDIRIVQIVETYRQKSDELKKTHEARSKELEQRNAQQLEAVSLQLARRPMRGGMDGGHQHDLQRLHKKYVHYTEHLHKKSIR